MQENRKTYLYAIGDIHGHLELLKLSLKKVNIEENKNNKLIFLGDYIDGGQNSAGVLYYIKELYEKYEGQVIALMGNHEEMFLQWLSNPKEYVYYFIEDKDLNTLKTFLKEDELKDIKEQLISKKDVIEISTKVAKQIYNNHKELIYWLKKLPYFFETKNQIFVHAGIEEDAEELWKMGTPKQYFTNKYPPTTGKFIKDIIAGHVGISTFNKKTYLEDIFYDGKSHYYIDGIDGNNKTKKIPVLKYEIESDFYSVL